MTQQTILLLEDDRNLGLIIQEHLQMNGYSAHLCTNGVEGLAAFHRGTYALCLVDVMMPRMDGFTFAREVRKKDGRVPLVFLTARSLKEDRIEGLSIGADDYVTKPFSIEELLLRIRAILKRTGPPSPSAEQPASFVIGTYRFDYTTRTLRRGRSKQSLTAREADLLRLLALHLNGTLERRKALRDLWGTETIYTSRSMDVFVSRLRKLLRRDRTVQILNDPGKGVRLVAGPGGTGRTL